jgi:hypothetical protein
LRHPQSTRRDDEWFAEPTTLCTQEEGNVMSKSKKLTKRLSFTAETLRQLSGDDLGEINGGQKREDNDYPSPCNGSARCMAAMTSSQC